MELQAGREAATVNGRAVRLSVPAQVVGGRTLVPLRFVSEGCGWPRKGRQFYDGRNAPAGAATGCAAATYSVAADGRHGLITRLTIQGVGTWNPTPASTP